MTPEEVEARFQRIEVQLELLARYNTMTAARVDAIAEKLESLENLVMKTADSVASLVRLFETHTSDGHGGKPKEEA